MLLSVYLSSCMYVSPASIQINMVIKIIHILLQWYTVFIYSCTWYFVAYYTWSCVTVCFTGESIFSSVQLNVSDVAVSCVSLYIVKGLCQWRLHLYVANNCFGVLQMSTINWIPIYPPFAGAACTLLHNKATLQLGLQIFGMDFVSYKYLLIVLW